jgi:hypothetical protein
MSFSNYNLTGFYTTNDSAIESSMPINEFFNILFSNAKIYKRMTAYVSAAFFYEQIQPISRFLNSSGFAEWYISEEVDKETYNSIVNGLVKSEDLRLKSLDNVLEQSETSHEKGLNLLAWLVALGNIKIRITFSDGITHDKVGLAIDDSGNRIVFNGSFNDTSAALNKNSESIIAFDDKTNQNVVNQIDNYFNQLENNRLSKVISYDLPNAYVDKIIRQRKSSIMIDDFEITNVLDFDDDSVFLFTARDSFDRRTFGRIMSLFDSHSDGFFRISYSGNVELLDKIIILDEFFKRNDLYYVGSRKVNNLLKEHSNQKLLFEHNIEIAKQIKQGQFDDKEFEYFKSVVTKQLLRTPYDLQFHSSFFAYKAINSCNFSVPGSGKTMIAYALFSFLKSLPQENNMHVDNILVIGPISSFASWEEEYLLNYGKLDSVRLGGSNKILNPHEYLQGYKIKELNLINYEALGLISRLETFLRRHRTLVVLDEAHYIKGRDLDTPAVRAEQVLRLGKLASVKLVMTGTPVTNSYSDLINYLDFLWPNQQSIFKFKDRDLRKMYIEESEEMLRFVNEAMYPHFFRITRSQLGLKAHPVYHNVIINPTQTHSEIYSEVFRLIKTKMIGEASIEKRLKDAVVIRLMQACFNPLLLKNSLSNYGFDFDSSILDADLDELNDFSSDKLQYNLSNFSENSRLNELIKLVNLLQSQNKKIIIWAIFTETIRGIQRALSDEYNVGLLFGDSSNEREDLINRFKNTTDLNILIANPASVAESISLHKQCNTAIYYEYSYNATHWMQSKDRIYRYGLPENVLEIDYYIFKTDKLIDNKIMDKLILKERLMEGVLFDKNEQLVNNDDLIREILDEN